MTRTMIDWTSEEQNFLSESGMMAGCSEDQMDLALRIREVLAQMAEVAPEEIFAFLPGKNYLALLRAQGITEKTFEENFYATLESLEGETVRYSFPICVAPEVLERTFLKKLLARILRIRLDRLPSFKKMIPARDEAYLRDSYNLTMGDWIWQVIHFWLSGRYAILAGIPLDWPVTVKATLRHLKKFPNRQQARRLSSCFPGRQKGDFTALADYPALRDLNLRKCSPLNDEHLRQIATLTNLKGLEFQFLSDVTEEGMSSLGKLTGLEELLFEYMPGSTGEINGKELPQTSLAFLISLKNLRRLDLPESFSSAPSLVIKDFKNSGVTDLPESSSSASGSSSRFCLSESKQLESLFVNGFVFDGYFKNLAKLTSLKRLFLNEGCYISEENASAFVNMTELRELEFSPSAAIANSVFSFLQKNEKLKILRLMGFEAGSISLKSLGGLTGLEELVIGVDYEDPLEKEIKGEELASFENLQKLERICIWSSIDWDEGLEHLRHLSRLYQLSCSNGSISGKGIEYLSQCRQLRSLIISACSSFNDDDLRKLSNLSHLTDLGIHNCHTISGSGFKDLESCGHLRSLTICDCKGLNRDFISSVKKLKGLKSLKIYGPTRLKRNWLRSIQKALPDCQIMFFSLVQQNFWNSGWGDIKKLFKLKLWIRSILTFGLFMFCGVSITILADLAGVPDTAGGIFGIVAAIIVIFLFLTVQLL